MIQLAAGLYADAETKRYWLVDSAPGESEYNSMEISQEEFQLLIEAHHRGVQQIIAGLKRQTEN